MKTIGLLGGMTWESTELYYRWINQGIKEKLGKLKLSAQQRSARVGHLEIEVDAEQARTYITGQAQVIAQGQLAQ